MAGFEMEDGNTFHNAEAAVEALPEKVEEDEPCTGFCEDCANSPFVIIDHEWVQSKSIQ